MSNNENKFKIGFKAKETVILRETLIYWNDLDSLFGLNESRYTV